MAATSRAHHHRLTIGDVLRGLVALLMLAVLLAGIPVGLLVVAGLPPLPSTLPSLDDLLGAITRQDDGTLLVAVLTWAGWIGWATLAVSIAVEIPAAARGVRAPRLAALGPQQRLAAGLVAAAALLFTGGTASLAAAPQPAHVDAANTVGVTDSPETSEAQSSVEQARPRVHIVEQGDTLWGIAEHHLGSGLRYPELYEASKQTTQPDGRRLTDPDLIYPGWEITIAGDDEHASSDPDRAQASEGTVGADERIQPSTLFKRTDQTEPASRSSSSPGRTMSQDGVPSPPKADSAEPSHTPSTHAPALLEATGAGAEDSEPMDPCTVGGIGAVLAGGLLFYLGAQRARQHRHRKPGQRISLPADGAGQLEEELRSVHDPVTLDHVNRALRTVTARCAMTGTPLPPLRFARLVRGQLELYLAEPAEVPTPFLPTVNPALWVLDPDGHILDREEADDYPAPYPSLVTIGHDLDGGLVLVELEHVGALAISGDGGVVAEVLTAIAAELATSLWSNDVRVSIVGAAPELANVFDSSRIRRLAGVDEEVDELIEGMATRAAADRAALAEVEASSVSVARMTGVAEGAWAPEILLLARPLTDDQRDRLSQLVHTQPRAAIAAVTTTGPPLTDWTIHLHPDEPGHAVVDPVGLAITPQRVGSEDNARLVELLAATRAKPTPAPTHWRVTTAGTVGIVDVPADAKPASPDRQQTARARTHRGMPDDGDRSAPLIAVLGPVEIQHASPLSEPTKRAQLTALAAFLALNPGATRDAVDEAMWPGRRVSLATRNTAMAKLRTWLGTDTDGDDYLPRAAADGYRLHPAIQTDWHLFTDLLPNGPASAPTGSLIAALDLVRDQPFKGVNPRRYIWAERIQQEMIAAIGDVADELARRTLRVGDHRLALMAVMTGLAAEPGSEQLWRQRLRAHHAAGDRVALERAADQLTALADELGGELEEETLELLHQLFSRPSSGREVPRGGHDE